MKKLKSTLPNMLLSLGLVTTLAAALLCGMYLLTKQPIAEAHSRNQLEAIRRVSPEFDNNPVADSLSIVTPGGTHCTVYPAYLHGTLNGAAVSTYSMDGFGGQITIMAGFNADGTVKDYQVLSHAETPGLGSKMELWFRDPKGARSILGKSPGQVAFFVTKDKDAGGQIDGITAATISSRAFLGAMREAYEAFRTISTPHDSTPAPAPKGDATTGASTKHHK